ncbi:MAG TPA: ankyrin repeat domain-containing protein [Pyrinomonadaceae bacterium]
MSVPIKAQITPDAPTHDLWQIAETGDIGQLEELLARGADVNASNEEGVTALMVAAYHGRLQMVQALTDHGADLNAMDTAGFTAAMLADHSGHEEILRTLVRRGAKRIPKPPASHASPVPSAQDETFDELSDYDVAPTGSNPEVRTLHDPPEIWDLVHETRTEFDPRSAFVGRLNSINPLVLAVIALIVGGGAVFGFMKLRGSGNDHAASTALAPSSAPAASTAPAASSPPVAASDSAEAPLRAEDGNTKTTSSSQLTEPKRTALSSNQQATSTPDIAGSKVDSKITVAAPSALPDKRIVDKPRLQNPTSSTTTGNTTVAPTTGNTTVAPTDDKDKTQTSATPGPKSDNEKVANPTAAKKEPDNAPSPQLSAPAKASPTPKAKVIPWP